MAARIDLTGQRFGLLTVLERATEKDGKRRPWLCICDCGNSQSAHTNQLISGVVRSCGCLVGRRTFPATDMTGQRFGRLQVIEFAGRNEQGRFVWRCKCDCGTERNYKRTHLMNDGITSCGCARGTHRHTTMAGKSPTYSSWASMMARCYYPSNPAHAYYKSLGIEVCERWHTFSNFLADMGERPEGTTLDRHPNQTGNYEPGNCRWATKKEQANNRVTNRALEYRGKTYTLAELCAETGLSKDFLHGRLRLGWDVTTAVELPKQPRRYYPRWRKAAGIS